MAGEVFKFRDFAIRQSQSPAKIGTDGVLLGAWAEVQKCQSILDIGCGTGLIALMLAQRCQAAQIEAWEKHPAAAEEARFNFLHSPWKDRLHLQEGDAFELFEKGESRFDLIVSNPPFFEGGQLSPNRDRNSWRHQENFSLAKLLQFSASRLTPQGRLCLILPYPLSPDFTLWAERAGLHFRRRCLVSSNQEKKANRILLEFSLQASPLKETHFSLRGPGPVSWRGYSKEYVQLTHSFFPWMPDNL